MRKGAIEQLGAKAQKETIKLSVEGLTSQAIADRLNQKYGSEITYDEVKNFLKRKQKTTAILLKEDKHFQTKMVKTYFDTIQQIRELNSEMWKLFYEIRKDPEYVSKSVECIHCHRKFSVQLKSFQTLLKAADTLLNQIKHVDTVLGRMQKKSLSINYNYVDLSKKIGLVMPQLLGNLEKRGLIKQNKKRVKEYYVEKPQIVEDEYDEYEEED